MVCLQSFFYYYLVFEAVGTAVTPSLLCQPRVRVKMIVENQMECRLTGETEDLGETLPQRHFCPSQNSTWPEPDLNPGRRGGKPATIIICFIIYLVCETFGTAATPGLLCQPRVRVKMIVENQMECRLTGETEDLGENLPQRHFYSNPICQRRYTQIVNTLPSNPTRTQ
jgi:hypothetical protein